MNTISSNGKYGWNSSHKRISCASCLAVSLSVVILICVVVVCAFLRALYRVNNYSIFKNCRPKKSCRRFLVAVESLSIRSFGCVPVSGASTFFKESYALATNKVLLTSKAENAARVPLAFLLLYSHFVVFKSSILMQM